MSSLNIVELLAWLNLFVEDSKLKSLQDKENEHHIHNILVGISQRLGYRYTENEIRERLLRELEQGETWAEDNFPRLFLHGSHELKTLDTDTTKQVEERIKALRLSEDWPPQRSRRSRSALPVSISTPKRNLRDQSTSEQPSSTPNTKRKRKGHSERAIGERKEKLLKVGHRANSVTRSQTKRSETVFLTIEINDTAVESPCASPSKNRRTPSPLSSHRANNQLTIAAGNIKKENGNISASGHDEAENLSQLNLHNYCLTTATSELVHYKYLYETLEKECANLKKEMRQLQSFCAQTGGISEKISKDFREKTRQINQMRERLNDRTDLEPLLSIGRIDDKTTSTQAISSHFEELKSHLISIPVINGTDKPMLNICRGRSIDLNTLICTVFDPKILDESDAKMETQAPELYELVQMLTGAAIHLWVFQSEYRSHNIAVTPLLHMYRKHIATLYGTEHLCDLDTAVHLSMVKEQHFNDHVVPEMASALTHRLLGALEPLIRQGFRRKTIRKLRLPLEGILGLAIRIRSLTLVGTEEHESIWPYSNVPYDANEMETRQSKPVNNTKSVRLPLCPGFRVYPKKKEMVEYHGFGNLEASRGTCKYLMKALVLT